MKSLYIAKSKYSPLIDFNANTGTLKIEGSWFTDIENGRKITNTITNWFEVYSENFVQKSILNIKLTSLNTSYSKLFLEILKKTETLFLRGHNIKINLFCKSVDEDFLETAEDFKEVLKVPINFCLY